MNEDKCNYCRTYDNLKIQYIKNEKLEAEVKRLKEILQEANSLWNRCGIGQYHSEKQGYFYAVNPDYFNKLGEIIVKAV